MALYKFSLRSVNEPRIHSALGDTVDWSRVTSSLCLRSRSSRLRMVNGPGRTDGIVSHFVLWEWTGEGPLSVFYWTSWHSCLISWMEPSLRLWSAYMSSSPRPQPSPANPPVPSRLTVVTLKLLHNRSVAWFATWCDLRGPCVQNPICMQSEYKSGWCTWFFSNSSDFLLQGFRAPSEFIKVHSRCFSFPKLQTMTVYDHSWKCSSIPVLECKEWENLQKTSCWS